MDKEGSTCAHGVDREREKERDWEKEKEKSGWIKPMIWNRGERVDRDKSKKKKRRRGRGKI